jgi:transcriptional regulator with XRE-family HTH domain
VNAQVKRNNRATQKVAATKDRNFRTFLLVSQFEAEEIGARIALARKERGMTQEELASVASFSKRSLQDYEAGVTIPYRHLQEIGGLLGRPVRWFLHGDPKSDDPADLDDLREEVAGIREDLAALRADLHLDESA